jgi:hypothetical protein
MRMRYSSTCFTQAATAVQCCQPSFRVEDYLV